MKKMNLKELQDVAAKLNRGQKISQDDRQQLESYYKLYDAARRPASQQAKN